MDRTYQIDTLFEEINILTIKDAINKLRWEDMSIRMCPYPAIRKESGFYYKYDINIPQYGRKGIKSNVSFRVHIHGHDVKKVDLNCPHYKQEMVNKMKETCVKKMCELFDLTPISV